MSNRKSLFTDMADEIAQAVIEVYSRYEPSIKLRKCSPDLVFYWVMQGANQAVNTVYRLSRKRI